MRRLALVLGIVLASGTTGSLPARAHVPEILLVPLPGAFQTPVAMAQHPDTDDIYVVEKTGTIRRLTGGLVFDPLPVLDVSAEVSTGLEQGLLGMAFSPDGDFLYIHLTDNSNKAHVYEYAWANNAVVAGSRREVLQVNDPFANHNCGTLIFGPDGYLYICMGDGGSAGDPHYNAQRLDTRLGKILRIDPRPSGEAPFTAPPSNPFAPDPANPDKIIPQGALPEIWAYGLRNPWKFSFDKATGDLWIADVGQGVWEEVNFTPATSTGGENYGWNHMEGKVLYEGRPPGATEPPNHHPPIHVYQHDGVACSVTGGYVYRGADEHLKGTYLFSDWCDGKMRWLQQQNGQVSASGQFSANVPQISSFGEDHDGELYAISLGGTVFKIVPVPA
jgi:glucose/arabinose dehydrogenase